MRTNPIQLAIVISAVALPAIIIIAMLLFDFTHSDSDDDDAADLQDVEESQVSSAIQTAPTAHIASDNISLAKAGAAGAAQPATTAKPDTKKSFNGKTVRNQVAHSSAQTKVVKAKPSSQNTLARSVTEAYISIVCKEGVQVFVDGVEKGKLASKWLTVTVSSGKHKLIVASKSGNLHSQDVDIEPGKTVEINPKFCV